MSDLEKLKEIFDSLSIKYKIKDTVTYNYNGYQYNQELMIDEGEGYYGFYTSFYFFDGKFMRHGCWE